MGQSGVGRDGSGERAATPRATPESRVPLPRRSRATPTGVSWHSGRMRSHVAQGDSLSDVASCSERDPLIMCPADVFLQNSMVKGHTEEHEPTCRRDCEGGY